MEMVHTVTGYTARFTIWSHCCIQTRQMSQDMHNCIFLILLKQTKWLEKPVKLRVYGQSNAMVE
jgi:hypothetical protein